MPAFIAFPLLRSDGVVIGVPAKPPVNPVAASTDSMNASSMLDASNDAVHWSDELAFRGGTASAA
jgi:hypothetical protein